MAPEANKLDEENDEVVGDGGNAIIQMDSDIN